MNITTYFQVNKTHNQNQTQDRYTKKSWKHSLWGGNETIQQHEYSQEWPNDTISGTALN